MKLLGVSLSLFLVLTVGQTDPISSTPPSTAGQSPVNTRTPEFNHRTTPSPCIKKRKTCPDILGSFCPRCDRKGDFLPQQCSGSTGFCWCVNVKTGQQFPGTEAQPWVKRVNCEGPCFKKQQSCSNKFGSFCPKCDISGNFLPQQCSGSTGFCWCANVKTGQKIPGTETPPGTTPVNCAGPCILQKQSCTQVPGSFCPQCDSSGNFLPQQCSPSTGLCWCVFISNGQKIPGTETRPGTRPGTTARTTAGTPPVNCVVLNDIGT